MASLKVVCRSPLSWGLKSGMCCGLCLWLGSVKSGSYKF